MNMQESNHQGRLLAKFIKFSDYVRNILAEQLQHSNLLILPARPLDGEEVMVIFFIVV